MNSRLFIVLLAAIMGSFCIYAIFGEVQHVLEHIANVIIIWSLMEHVDPTELTDENS